MPPWSRFLFEITVTMCLTVPVVCAYFGLTSSEHSITLVRGNSVVDRTSKPKTSTDECGLLKLTRRQRKLCTRGLGMAATLQDAIRLSQMECEYQFRFERWNCSLGRRSVLQKGFKETSFLHAISSAGLVHSVSRACSMGQLSQRCTCDQSQNAFITRQAWKYGGCGDNIRYGQKFAKRFLRAAKKLGADVRAKVDEHNTATGIKIVQDGVIEKCKCHGISGSCAVQTCWKQLVPFHKIGDILKKKYETATRVVINANNAKGKVTLLKKKKNAKNPIPKSSSLVYIEKSPSFCKRTKYSDGTKGRQCKKHTNCASICCGRGYNVKSRIVTKACECQVIWCCQVKCKKCTSKEEIFLCK
uniref:Protein Wnt n=1 Tax=Terebratalia transversa TaxID=34513 RepID=A0AAU7EA71_TERTR